VLAGGKVPYLLRTVGDEQENRFQFVGQAYVHGIMHGEAVKAEDGVFPETVLV
jgi:hypothetical protein